MKKIVLLLLFIILIGLSSCRSLYRADKYYNVKWSSEYPLIEFTVKSKEESLNLNGVNEGFLIIDEERIEIVCLWTLSNGLDVFYKSKISNATSSLSEDDLAFNGNYKMKGKRCILTINIDHVYNHLYSTITLKMSDL